MTVHNIPPEVKVFRVSTKLIPLWLPISYLVTLVVHSTMKKQTAICSTHTGTLGSLCCSCLYLESYCHKSRSLPTSHTSLLQCGSHNESLSIRKFLTRDPCLIFRFFPSYCLPSISTLDICFIHLVFCLCHGDDQLQKAKLAEAHYLILHIFFRAWCLATQ